jgi:membrane protease YdiL (CAAX protease family)
MSGVGELLRRNQVAAYFVLTFVLTWLAFIPWYASNGDGIPWFTFGPFAAALILSALTGGWPAVRGLLAKIVQWRVGILWYLVALGLPLVIQLAAILINPLAGSPAPAWGKIPPLAEIIPMVLLFAVFSGPLGEEPGWRGFALPRLLERYPALTASLILGVVWAAWHLPLLLVDDLTVYGTINAVLAAVVFTWVYQNTGGSVLIPILMHMSHQNSVRYLGKVFAEPDHSQQQWIAVALWGLVVIAIVAVKGGASFASGHVRAAATNPTG